MANSNPYLILRRCRDATILQLRQLFSPANNTAVVPPFQYNYVETAASGNVKFYGNPSNLDTFTIGTNTITFVTGAPSGLQVQIGLTQQITLANLVALINANSTILLVIATVNSISGLVNITAVTQGISGNNITLATTSTVLKVSSSTLTQGGLFDFDNSDVFISDATSQDYADWPSIIVNTAMANETRYLDSEGNFEKKNSSNVVIQSEIFSSLVVTIAIKIYSIDDTLARDNIADLIYNNLSEIRDVLAANGIEMIDRTLPNETRIAQDQRIYIENPFILRVYCEWSDSLTPITNITSVSVTVPVQTSAVPVITSPLSVSYDSTLYRQFVVDNIVDATHLEVENAMGLANGNIITQGLNTTTIINIIDNNHLQVASTSGWIIGYANDTSAPLPFNYIITASGNPSSYGWISTSILPLPAGLSLVDSSNGLITGIPTVTGTFYTAISAINASGTGTQSLTITIS